MAVVLRELEASAASSYFDAWGDHSASTVRFVTRDAMRIPEHWRRFEGRRSSVTKATNNRRAGRPLNALLNLTYALAEIECRLASTAVGLDPGLGFMHTDLARRDSPRPRPARSDPPRR